MLCMLVGILMWPHKLLATYLNIYSGEEKKQEKAAWCILHVSLFFFFLWGSCVQVRLDLFYNSVTWYSYFWCLANCTLYYVTHLNVMEWLLCSTHTPFLVEDDQHWDQEADEEDDGDRNKDHSVEGICISCWVKHVHYRLFQINQLQQKTHLWTVFTVQRQKRDECSLKMHVIVCRTFCHIEIQSVGPGSVASQGRGSHSDWVVSWTEVGQPNTTLCLINLTRDTLVLVSTLSKREGGRNRERGLL